MFVVICMNVYIYILPLVLISYYLLQFSYVPNDIHIKKVGQDMQRPDFE